MIPKVEFRYSWIYDENLKDWIKRNPSNQRKDFTPEDLRKYAKEIEKKWRKYAPKILKEIQKISSLRWKEKKIICYIVSRAIPFSDPLTMPIFKDKNRFIDVLTHELIHQIFTQEGNLKQAEMSWDYFFKKYKEENYKVQIHIPLQAIHKHIYLKLFNEKRFEEELRIMGNYKDYKKAWEIVNTSDYKELIKEFKDNLK